MTIVKSGNKFTVTANPNTATTPPSPAVITISAGKATNATIAVTQLAASTETYLATEDALKSATTKVWTFSESSDYVSIEFGAEQAYTLLSKTPLTRATDNMYLLFDKDLIFLPYC